MVERSESDPKPNLTFQLSSEEENWRAAATKYKFLGISPVSLFEYLCNLFPEDYREEYQSAMIDTFKLLLGERLEKRPGSVPFYLYSEYMGFVTSSFAMRSKEIKIPRFW